MERVPGRFITGSASVWHVHLALLAFWSLMQIIGRKSLPPLIYP